MYLIGLKGLYKKDEIIVSNLTEEGYRKDTSLEKRRHA